MGVHGLTPFLQKKFPSVVRAIPNRFRDLRGKTIAIDGTLITQRFHFAQVPHRFKHVLGWYRLLTELRDNGVNAICIFDGNERSAAKLQEAERRRLARRLVTVRSGLEADRLHRLQSVHSILKDLQHLPPKPTSPTYAQAETALQETMESLTLTDSDRPRDKSLEIPGDYETGIATEEPELIKDLLEEVEEYTQSLTSTPADGLIETWEGDDELDTSPSLVSSEEYDYDTSAPSPDDKIAGSELAVVDPGASEAELRDVSLDYVEDSGHDVPLQVTALPESSEPVVTGAKRTTEGDSTSAGTHIAHVVDDQEVDVTPSSMDAEDIPLARTTSQGDRVIPVEDNLAEAPATKASYEAFWERLNSLHESFLDQGRSRQADTAATETSLANDETTALSSVSLTRTEYDMQESKLQAVLTKGEERVWASLKSTAESIDFDLEDYSPLQVADLISRSRILLDSYERRSRPPTSDTYEECKMIIRAMGMPCFDTDGPYEAEALASSLSRQGLVDFVASEDTDVLVYGACLLRNITTREKELVCISGAEVREALNLYGSSFLDFALLLGTDFSARLHSVGPHRALRFIAAHGSIERVIEKETKYAPADVDAYLAQIQQARDVFTTLPTVPDAEQLSVKEIDRENVTELLGRFGLMRAAFDEDWDPQVPLAGNYFQDSPYTRGRRMVTYEYDDDELGI